MSIMDESLDDCLQSGKRQWRHLAGRVGTKSLTGSVRIGRWLIGASFALLILAGFTLFPPRVSVDHAPHYLADESDSHGFFSPETDPAGNRFVWTEPHASTTFTSIGRQPVVLRLMLRSAAVAGGPDAPILLIVNGAHSLIRNLTLVESLPHE